VAWADCFLVEYDEEIATSKDEPHVPPTPDDVKSLHSSGFHFEEPF
jgi:hypothetical protein